MLHHGVEFSGCRSSWYDAITMIARAIAVCRATRIARITSYAVVGGRDEVRTALLAATWARTAIALKV
jgi:hypothetical protein